MWRGRDIDIAYQSSVRASVPTREWLIGFTYRFAPSPFASVDALGWRVGLNRTLALKSLRHYLPRLLLALDLAGLPDCLVERLCSPTAVERTRPERTVPRRKGVRIAYLHYAYKAA